MVEVNQHNTTWIVWHAYDLVSKHKGLNVNAILNLKFMSQVVQHDVWPPFTNVNKVDLLKGFQMHMEWGLHVGIFLYQHCNNYIM